MRNELERAQRKRLILMLRRHCKTRNEALALVHEALPPKWGRAGEEAEEFLREQLASGPKRLTRLIERAEPLGINYRTLRRAAINIGCVNVTKGFGKNRVATWSLTRR